MKIIYFIDTLTAGGKERRLSELLKGLKGKPGIDYQLVAMSKDIHYKEILDLNIKIHFLIRSTRKDISIFKKFYEICKNYRPDIVHCWDSMTAIYSIYACKMLHIKLVNGMVIDSPMQQNIRNRHWLRARITFPFSDKIVGNSIAGLKAYNASTFKSICIYNGFNFERNNRLYDANGISEDLKNTNKKIVGMVATFSTYKDYPTYFTAATMILDKRNDVVFLAIGTDTNSLAARSLIPESHKEKIISLGKRSDIESLVNLIDIGILATFTEGVSNSIMEYMAMGKPVIATSGGGTNEIVQDGITGFLVNPGDSKQLSEKIEYLLDHEDIRKKMGEAGLQRIKNEFSIDKMVNNFIDCYQSLSDQKN
jgi:glycosyltransferase involved in cell wall biosynthesis